MRSVCNLLWKTALSLIFLAGLPTQASAQTWSLTTAQRQAYLNYYAPEILKRADENNNKQGRDWITNFDFDQDNDFSNNRVNWLNVPNYVNASANGPSAYDRWRIRPTLYTAIIEYMEGGSKSLVLFYHIFNARRQYVYNENLFALRTSLITTINTNDAQPFYKDSKFHRYNHQ